MEYTTTGYVQGEISNGSDYLITAVAIRFGLHHDGRQLVSRKLLDYSISVDPGFSASFSAWGYTQAPSYAFTTFEIESASGHPDPDKAFDGRGPRSALRLHDNQPAEKKPLRILTVIDLGRAVKEESENPISTDLREFRGLSDLEAGRAVKRKYSEYSEYDDFVEIEALLSGCRARGLTQPTLADLGHELKRHRPGEYDDWSEQEPGAELTRKHPEEFSEFAEVP